MTHTVLERKPETMGRRLAALRARFGLGQQEVAEHIGLRQATVSRLELDRFISPPIDTISKLATLYGVTIDYLVNGEEAT